MNCTNPVRLHFDNISKIKYPDGLLVHCGKCTNCRIQHRREWALRMTHELPYHKDNSFVTLTYADEFLPENKSLKKVDLQLFLKRLRKTTNEKIKYFASGEYGSNTDRPHYHLIFFGLGLKYEDKIKVTESWPYCDWTVKKIYKKSFGTVTRESINYVAKYIDKKYSGDLEYETYIKQGRENVFRIVSNGIGLQYVNDNINRLRKDLSVTLNGVRVRLPRYYMDKLDLSWEERCKAMAVVEDSEREYNKKFCAEMFSNDDVYKNLTVSEILTIEHTKRNNNIIKEKNYVAKQKLYSRDLE